MPPIVRPKKRPLRAVGCYVFAGGFTVGVRAAGFDVACHLEGRPAYGREIVALNLPDVTIYEGVEAWPIDDLADGPEIDLLYGNPPCAAWSGNNPNAHVEGSWKSDLRVSCTREHFGLLEALRPKVWMWESVTAAATRGRDLVDELSSRALELGYSVTEVFHDAKDLGTPQTRKRWFMVAHRIEVDFPESALLPEVSAVEALSRVRPVGPPAYDSGSNSSFDEHLPMVKPGQRLRDYQERHLVPRGGWEVKPNGHFKGRVGFGHVRLKDSGPATATVGYSMVHPTEHRFLSVNEVQALAGFPQSYRFPGAARGADQLDLIARGVCPPVGEWFARRVAEAVARDAAVEEPKVSVVDLIAPRSKIRPKIVKTKPTVETKSAQASILFQEIPEGAVTTMKTKNVLRGRLGVPGSKPQDLDRRYDTTQLRETGHGQRVHRDYAAHFFRWGWASRFVEAGKTTILDVGCGQDVPLVKVLTASLSAVPAKYVGVDLNKISRKPGISWVEAILDEYDFPTDWADVLNRYGPFSLISCFEVVEHMHREDGLRLLTGIKECLTDDGRALISTPVYDGRKMAANHIKEYTVQEMRDLVEEAGLEVVERFGTFASWNMIRRVCTKTERDLLDETGRFYGGDVLACFLAPKYPDASRNNAWVLRRKS